MIAVMAANDFLFFFLLKMTFFWAAVLAVLRQLFLSWGCILKSTSIFPPQKADLSLGSLQRDHSFAARSTKNVSSGEDH